MATGDQHCKVSVNFFIKKISIEKIDLFGLDHVQRICVQINKLTCDGVGVGQPEHAVEPFRRIQNIEGEFL